MIRSTFQFVLVLAVVGMLIGVGDNTAKAQDPPQYICGPATAYPASEKWPGYETMYIACTFRGPVDKTTFRSWVDRVYNVELGRKHQNLLIRWDMNLGSGGDQYVSDSGVIEIKDGKWADVKTPQVRTNGDGEKWRETVDERLLLYLKEYETRPVKNR